MPPQLGGAWTSPPQGGDHFQYGLEASFLLGVRFVSPTLALPAAVDLMVRRENVNRTDFIAAFSPDVRQIEQVAVRKANGGTANAVGVKVTRIDGTTFDAIVNYEAEGTVVQLGKLKTSQPFAADQTKEAVK